jgi:hypothetical protein
MEPARPDHITPEDWDHMPWHARRRAAMSTPPTGVVRSITTARSAPRTNEPTRPRVRVYRERPGVWVITNGINIATCKHAEQAWRLLADLDHTPKATNR